MQGELEKKGTNFYGYLARMQHKQKKGGGLITNRWNYTGHVCTDGRIEYCSNTWPGHLVF